MYLHQFASLTEARLLIGEFIRRYNTEWRITRRADRALVLWDTRAAS